MTKPDGTSTAAAIPILRATAILSEAQAWSTLECNAFEHPVWIDFARKEVLYLLAQAPEALGDGPQAFLSPLLARIRVLQARGEAVRILDIGGGVGQTIPYVLQHAEHYTVVDGPHNAQFGKALFAHFSQVEFVTHIPRDKRFSLVVINGTLQYVQEWVPLLKTACGLGASALFIGRLPFGVERTLHGLQNIVVGEPPVSAGQARRWIFSRQDFDQALLDAGWKLDSDVFVRPSQFRPQEPSAPAQAIEIRSMLLTPIVSNSGRP